MSKAAPGKDAMMVNYVGQNGIPIAPNPLQVFRKSKPTALGTVQIMIGIVCFLMSVVSSMGELPFSIYSGITYWGPIFYIISGSLTVAAEKHLTTCLVKGSLGTNVWSAILAASAVILVSMDFVKELGNNPCNSQNNTTCEHYVQLLNKSHGLSGLQLVLIELQFFISFSCAVFGCKATRGNSEVETMTTKHPESCSVISPFDAHGGQKEVLCFANPALNVNDLPKDDPPAYCQISEEPVDSKTKEVEKDKEILEKS